MPTAATLKSNAQRELRNFRSFVRRTGTTGWVDRAAAPNFRGSFRAVLAYEDVAGVDAAYELGRRLDDLRREATNAGLLTANDVFEIETEETSR